MSAGKGDKQRNCFSKKYKNNYDDINWKGSQDNLIQNDCTKSSNNFLEFQNKEINLIKDKICPIDRKNK
jgi:hypothetical protein